jgi:dehydrogenase/reductase SDR family protein 7B
MSGTGRTVLITGASAGIGQAATRKFIERGDRVIAVARDERRLEEVAAEFGGNSRIVTVAADVTDAGSMDAMVAEVSATVGCPDVIVANAGIGLDALFSRMTDEALRKVFDVNVFGLVRTVRPFLEKMIERGSGRVLLISSIVGKRGTPYYSAYSASKFALHGMADALRCETWNTGVTIGLICPSSTSTEFQDRLLREGPGQKRVRARRHTPESVAEAVVKMSLSRRREIILSSEARLLWFADALFPGLVDRFLAGALRSKE